MYDLDRDPAVGALLDHLLEHVDTAFFVSTVTELELYSYPDLNDEEEAGIARLLSDMFVVPLDSRLARSAGSLRRVYRLKTPDSAIAATALLTKTTLLTGMASCQPQCLGGRPVEPRLDCPHSWYLCRLWSSTDLGQLAMHWAIRSKVMGASVWAPRLR